MNKKLKQRWVDALRSGDYPQTQCELTNGAGFCCLGVLCDIVDDTKWIDSEDGVVSYDFGNNMCSEFPSHVWLVEVVNLPHYQAQALATFNDDDGYGFNDIADWIEDNVKETSND
jgi:hypothetical protein